MTFDEILDQALEILQRRGRVTYRTLKDRGPILLFTLFSERSGVTH